MNDVALPDKQGLILRVGLYILLAWMGLLVFPPFCSAGRHRGDLDYFRIWGGGGGQRGRGPHLRAWPAGGRGLGRGPYFGRDF